jgi:hypothetical protein
MNTNNTELSPVDSESARRKARSLEQPYIVMIRTQDILAL